MKGLTLNLKTIFLILPSIFVVQTASPQVLISILLGDKLNSDNLEFGIDGGFNRSYLSGIAEAKGMNHFHLGFYFDIRLKNEWFINTGVRVKSNVGAENINPYPLDNEELDSVFSDSHITRNIGYFYVPIHVKYKFCKQFFINAGIQAGLRNKAQDQFINSYYDKNDVVFKNDIKNRIKRLDFGLSGGLGYKFQGNGMNLGFTYYYGLVNIDKLVEQKSNNSTFYLYMDIPIGAGYKEAKQQN